MIKPYTFTKDIIVDKFLTQLDSAGIRYEIMKYECKDIDRYVITLSVPTKEEYIVNDIAQLYNKKNV